MSCPALFMRKQGVTKDWDNALINFDQKSWFPGRQLRRDEALARFLRPESPRGGWAGSPPQFRRHAFGRQADRVPQGGQSHQHGR